MIATQSNFERIDAGGGRHFDAYVSKPKVPNGRAVIVLQEIFGVTTAIREVADRYAAEGYLAFAPDLYWRITPGMELSHSKEDLARAFEALAQFDEDAGVRDIGKTADHIRAQLGASTRVVVLGLCLGGKLAYLCAARLDVDAAVSFYGVGIEKNLDEIAALACPLMLHFGARDNYITPEVRATIAQAVAPAARASLHVYDEAGHGFYTRGDSPAKELAHARTLAFLDDSCAVKEAQ